jgi:molecular chaperone GrpE
VPEERNNQHREPDEAGVEASGPDEEVSGSPDGPDPSEQDLETLRREAEENRDKLLRLAAEFENYKKRMERERDITLKYAGENILRELLNTLDNLDRALEQGTADSADVEKKLNSMLEGVDLTRKGLLSTLEKFEVSPLESIGREFDPNEHEALTMEASSDVPANHVLQEFVKGYRYKDRLLRAAKVSVSKGAE